MIDARSRQGAGVRDLRPATHLGWDGQAIAIDSVAAEGWSGPGGGRMMGEGADMAVDSGMETGGAKGRMMGGLATGADVELTGGMTALARKTKGGIN